MANEMNQLLQVAFRTPFVQQGTGEWVLILLKNETLEWGQMFDAEFGYRVFIKFSGSVKQNAMTPDTARTWARRISVNEDRPEVLQVAAAMRDMADVVEKLNNEWAARGAPAQGLDKGVAGHA